VGARAPAPPHEGRALRSLYTWRVWARWIALVVVVATVGIVLAYLVYRASDADLGNAIAAALWFSVIPVSVGYFEITNQRLRRASGLNPDSDGLALAIVGLALGLVLIFLAGPISIVLAVLAWRKLRRAGSPIVAGIPTAIAAFIVGCLDIAYAILSLSDVLP
jgi:hypothetical protein